MKKIIVSILAFSISTLSMAYKPPVGESKSVSVEVQATKEEIFKASKRALALEGYQITSSDLDAGVITTASKDYRIDPSYADCGMVMGIDYLKDKRTKTTVAQNIIIDDNSLSIKSNIQGEYKVGSTTFDVTLTCLSKGLIEADLVEKIKSNLK